MALHLPLLGNEPDPTNSTAVDHDGTVWQRQGHCCGCGACCVGDVLDPTLAFCRYFEHSGEGAGTCRDRTESNNYYQQACRHYPQVPSQIADKPDCTYTFVKVSRG